MTEKEVTDALFLVLKSNLNGLCLIHWPNFTNTVPNNGDSYCQVNIKFDKSYQSTISRKIGSRRFDTYGSFIVKLFTEIGKGNKQSLDLSNIIKNSLIDSRVGVNFINTKTLEAGAVGLYHQTNIILTFNFSEVR